jgi:putative transposase
MDALIFNAVLRIDSDGLRGLYRVLALQPGGDVAWLACIGTWPDSDDQGIPIDPTQIVLNRVAVETLEALACDGKLRPVELQRRSTIPETPVNHKATARRIWMTRRVQAAPFLDPSKICRALTVYASISTLVRACEKAASTPKGSAHRLWRLLCLGGFDAASLYPKYHECGAPGVSRPAEKGRQKVGAKSALERVGGIVEYPQRGMTSDDRSKILHHARALMRPGLSQSRLYPLIINRVYVKSYVETAKGREPVTPVQGTYPTPRQVRHIVESGITNLDRARLKTTEGHFQRNLRGLVGRSYDNVPGPGHSYAIDSTIGDIHLRSAICPAWPVGRPIVYIMVDIWSTAIVGFYACLKGPSWDTAKLALFSGCCNPGLLASLWGYEHFDVLTPAPTLPFYLLTDRGEYVSAAARETGDLMGFSLSVNPAYRPDLKGLVEVFHRIAKDWQSPFVPGAIDARRPELELRSGSKPSAMSLRNYVQYLQSVFSEYNLCADRRHRLTSEMMACGVQPTPAGLWRFGHEAGFGFQKFMPQDRLITGLLQKSDAVARRNGIFMANLQYESEIARTQKWTEQARDKGVLTQSAFHFPGSVSRFWWPDPVGALHEFRLRGNALTPGETTLEEWEDALAYEGTKRAAQQHARVEVALKNIEKQKSIIDQAIAKTTAADAAYVGKPLKSREARALENMSAGDQPPDSVPVIEPDKTPTNASYDAMMDQVFREQQDPGSEQ